ERKAPITPGNAPDVMSQHKEDRVARLRLAVGTPAAVVPVVVVFVAIPTPRLVVISATFAHVVAARPHIVVVTPGVVPADPDVSAPRGVVLLDRRRWRVTPAVDNHYVRQSGRTNERHERQPQHSSFPSGHV